MKQPDLGGNFDGGDTVTRRHIRCAATWPAILRAVCRQREAVSGYGECTTRGAALALFLICYDFTAFLFFWSGVQGCIGIHDSLILKLVGRAWSHSGMADLHITSCMGLALANFIPTGVDASTLVLWELLKLNGKLYTVQYFYTQNIRRYDICINVINVQLKAVIDHICSPACSETQALHSGGPSFTGS